MPSKNAQEWLLIFYTVPAHPVNARMKIWRKLAKAGAVQLKGAVYLLPASEEHEELLQWLIGEVRALGGDGAFVRTPEIRTMTDKEIRTLFQHRTEEELSRLEKQFDVVERKVQGIRKGTFAKDPAELIALLGKVQKEFSDVEKRDFFFAPGVAAMKNRIQALGSALKNADRGTQEKTTSIKLLRTADYRNRMWATRKNPFVDRMASAWLIRRFIDPKAQFRFVEEKEIGSLGPGTVAFDVHGGEFTHHGDLCTFEVLVKAFGIKDKAVAKIAEIVHDLDLKDDKYGRQEAVGIEDILAGIRKTAKSDPDGLERGMAAFEMLYQSKS